MTNSFPSKEYSLLNAYNYTGKSHLSSVLDGVSYPLRSLFGGRKICLITHTSKEISTVGKIVIVFSLSIGCYFNKRLLLAGAVLSCVSLIAKKIPFLFNQETQALSTHCLHQKVLTIQTEINRLSAISFSTPILSLAEEEWSVTKSLLINTLTPSLRMNQIHDLTQKIVTCVDSLRKEQSLQKLAILYTQLATYEKQVTALHDALPVEQTVNAANPSTEELNLQRDRGLVDVLTSFVNQLPKPEPHGSNADSALEVTPSYVIGRPPQDRQTNSFESVTRQLKNIPELLAEAAKRQTEVEHLCSLLPKNTEDIVPRYKEIITLYRGKDAFLDKDALKAFHDKRISCSQFCTLTYLAATLRDFPQEEIYIHPLFNQDGVIDPLSKQIIHDSFAVSPGRVEFFYKKEARKIEYALFQEIQNAEISEQCFFYVAFPKENRATKAMQTALDSTIGLRLFSWFSCFEKSYRMIPSFSMMQTCIDVHGEANAVAAHPTIKLSTRADLRLNAETRGRDMFTPFTDCNTPSMADGFRISDFLEFLLHDFYHCLVCNYISNNIRQKLGHVADVIETLQKQYKNESTNSFENAMKYAFLETFHGRMVDMEFAFFRRLKPKGKLDFLLTLDKALIESTKSRMFSKLQTLPQHSPKDPKTPWSIIQKEIEQQAQTFRAQECTPENLFDCEFNDFCQKNQNTLFKKLAHEIYKENILTYLGITKKDLNLAINEVNKLSLNFLLINPRSTKPSLIRALLAVWEETESSSS